MISVGAALAFLGAGSAAAGPLDGLPGSLGQVPNSSADFGLPDLLPAITGLLPGIGDPGAGGASTGKSRCDSVIQVGDSTSVNVDRASALPSAQDTASAQYRRVGVGTVAVDALSGRAIVDGPGIDAEQAVASRLASGARGCWVIAMGINDAGAIASGSSVGADARIDRIMRQLAGQPVLWPTVATANPTNQAFGAASMATFNDALRRATSRYANLAVYDWASVVGPDAFAGDHIHYTASGTADRNHRFADALAMAYPPGAGAVPTVRWVSR